MTKEALIEFEGVIKEILPDSRFRVTLDNGYETMAYVAGRVKRNRIRIAMGDRVMLEMSPYDLSKSRIIFRNKDERPAVRGIRRPVFRRRR
jgi:translation initiation factor IF-1